jgi:nucleotide-binding universal stress UspA family protein
MTKDIVVNLSEPGQTDFAVKYALSVARTFGAHLTGIAFLYDPVIPDGALGGVPVQLIEAQREENCKAAQSAVQRFEENARAAGVSASSRTVEASVGGGAMVFGKIARRFDLVVLGQSQREYGASEEVMIESALFESGRPVMLVPYIQREGLALNRVLLCWDGSRTAARAIGDAMPLLERAKEVDVVIVAEERKEEDMTGSHMAEHLARHGITATVKRLVKGDISIDSVVLSYAADTGADLIVMGGYGHSRFREFILGGMTRGILESMTVPVLMSH